MSTVETRPSAAFGTGENPLSRSGEPSSGTMPVAKRPRPLPAMLLSATRQVGCPALSRGPVHEPLRNDSNHSPTILPRCRKPVCGGKMRSTQYKKHQKKIRPMQLDKRTAVDSHRQSQRVRRVVEHRIANDCLRVVRLAGVDARDAASVTGEPHALATGAVDVSTRRAMRAAVRALGTLKEVRVAKHNTCLRARGLRRGRARKRLVRAT